jgi:hypothetical protein
VFVHLPGSALLVFFGPRFRQLRCRSRTRILAGFEFCHAPFEFVDARQKGIDRFRLSWLGGGLC